MARRGGGLIKGKKLAVMGPFLVLPFMLLCALVPWASVRVTIHFTCCWAAPCKMLLICGANFLLDSPAWALCNFSQFLLACLLPVRIKGVVKGRGVVGVGAMRTLVVEVGALIAFFRLYESMGAAVRHVAHCVVLYVLLDLPHRVASMGFMVVCGVETYPVFHKPWFSTSLTNFWGNRWDLTANVLLRHSVYNPLVNLLTKTNTLDIHLSLSPTPAAFSRAKIDVKPLAFMSSSLVSPPTKPLPLSVRLVGVSTTFFVSGLIHELLFCCITQAVAPTWEVTAFFIVHGLATSAEITLRRVCPTHPIFKMPRPLKIVLTMCFMYATTAWLFFPQLVRAGTFMTCTLEYRVIEEMMGIRSLNTPKLLL